MRKWLQRLRVSTQLIAVCAVSVASLALFSGYCVVMFRQDALATRAEYAQQLVNQLQQTVEGNYDSYAKILRLISFHRDVQSFLLSESAEERVELYSALKRALIDIATLSSSITDIAVVDGDGVQYNLADNAAELPEMDLSEGDARLSARQTRASSQSRSPYLAMGRRIASIDSYNQTNLTIGSVYLVLSANAFTGDVQHDEGSDIWLYLADGEGRVVWSSDDQARQETLDEARANAPGDMVDSPLERLGYHIYAVTAPGSSPFQNSDIGLWRLLLVGAGMVLLLVLLWAVFARNMVRPLHKLRRFIKRLKGSETPEGTRIALAGYHEAEVIGNEFNQLLDRSRTLTRELVNANTALYESKLLAKQSELSHLRSQINPHFLYNTLETMVGIAYTNGQPELAEIARSLSLIFKFSIKGESMVPLETEWKIARCYIDIQHYRFSDRFDVKLEMDAECAGLLVPKLILQPIIENAIVHGIEGKDGFCHLRVGAKLEGGALCLTVADDGAGMSAEALQAINQRLESAEPAQESYHIGICNVHSRIRLQYGPDYGVRIRSKPGEGTLVTITLPKEAPSEKDSDR